MECRLLLPALRAYTASRDLSALRNAFFAQEYLLLIQCFGILGTIEIGILVKLDKRAVAATVTP